jgi:hypothetical protein
MDQCLARPVCSFIAGPCTRRRSHARQPELRDSRRRARRRRSWRPGFSFRGEARCPSFLSSTSVDEGTAGPASSTMTEVRGPMAVLFPICAGARALAASEGEEAAGVAPDQPAAPAAMPGRYLRVGGRWRPHLRSAPDINFGGSLSRGGVDLLQGDYRRLGTARRWRDSRQQKRRRRRPALVALRVGGGGNPNRPSYMLAAGPPGGRASAGPHARDRPWAG